MQKLQYPFLKAAPRKPNALDQYYSEAKTLGEVGIDAILDEGRKWSQEITSTLQAGGAAIFPHTFLSQCGYQIAACIHAILDSGANQVLALGTLHPMSEVLLQARSKELNNEDTSLESSWGVLGPGLPRDDCWKKEFSLDLFKLLLDREVKRRNIQAPRIIERYPSLVNKDPASLPGIKELEEIAKDSVIVATDDMCHHGVGYGVGKKEAIDCDETGYQFAKKQIDDGYALLCKGDYQAYFYHWMNPSAIGDPTDVATTLKHLIGDMSAHILDLKLVDVSLLFENNIAPSWVAATLVKLTPIFEVV